MYSTCIGLILRGYHDFENGRLRFVGEGGNIVHISAEEMKAVKDMIDNPEVPSTEEETEDRKKRNIKRTENFKKLFDGFKGKFMKFFEEVDDQEMQ
jgi:cell division protein FtsA